MTKKLRARQAALEKQGQFATDMNEKHRTFDALDIDKGYEYLPRRPLERVRRAVALSIVTAVGPLVTWFAQGARVVGKENLRALRGGGAISVCNHVHTLDTLMIKNALGAFRTFHTGSYYLLKKGALGRLFKAGGFLPVGTRFSDMKRLQEAVSTLVQNGKIVNFYPEHALWPQYERLRPFQSGAFHCAVKAGVPVLPVFVEFRATRLRTFFHLPKKVIVHILPAVQPPPPESGTVHARAQALSAAVFEAMRAAGNACYGCEVRAADYVSAGEEGEGSPARAASAAAPAPAAPAPAKPKAEKPARRVKPRAGQKKQERAAAEVYADEYADEPLPENA